MVADREQSAVTVSALEGRDAAMTANIESLTAIVKAGSGWTVDQKMRSKELQERRSDLRSQVEGKQNTLSALRRDCDALQEHIDRGQHRVFWPPLPRFECLGAQRGGFLITCLTC